MADFNITVDTRQMADSLDRVKSNVQTVTSSVVAMQSAVLLAQQQAAARVCKNVDAGFYFLLNSQLEQKIAAVSSEMFSTMQLMESFKNDMEKIMVVMQDDYDRVKMRYLKHFGTLDRALENRVHELDKYAYEISRNYKMSQFRSGSEVIKAICYSEDTQLMNVKQSSATVKNKTAKSIKVMTDDVLEQLKYAEALQNILKDIEFETAQNEFVPVIFTETDSLVSKDTSIKDIVTSSEADFSTTSKYLNQLRESSENFSWKEVNDKDFEPIKNSFRAKVGKEVHNERVANEMLRLFTESKWTEAEVDE